MSRKGSLANDFNSIWRDITKYLSMIGLMKKDAKAKDSFIGFLGKIKQWIKGEMSK